MYGTNNVGQLPVLPQQCYMLGRYQKKENERQASSFTTESSCGPTNHFTTGNIFYYKVQ